MTRRAKRTGVQAIHHQEPPTMTHWKPIDADAGLWTFEVVEHGVSMFRAVAVRLRDGTLAVVSPVRGAPSAALEELAGLGRPAFLLAPNHYHNLGLSRYAASFDGAVVTATAVAAPRVARQSGCAVAPLEGLRAQLPEHVTVLELPGSRAGEVWLRVETSRGVAWVVGDAFFHVPRVPPTRNGALMWLIRGAPGLRIGPTFTWVALGDRGVYAAWLAAQLARDAPTILVPAHGDVLEGEGLAARLGQLAAARLPRAALVDGALPDRG